MAGQRFSRIPKEKNFLDIAEYYQNFVTEKSFQLLKKLQKDYQFILIGGWAVFFYTRALKSKDIDIIVDFDELDKLKENHQVNKNERLKKYEINFGEFDVDIYLPFYSQFCLPIEFIQEHLKAAEGFQAPRLEILLILKQQAYEDRKGSAKGEKDKLDILALLNQQEFDFTFYLQILKSHQFDGYRDNLILLLKETKEASELNLNVYQLSKLKKKVLSQLRSV